MSATLVHIAAVIAVILLSPLLVSLQLLVLSGIVLFRGSEIAYNSLID